MTEQELTNIIEGIVTPLRNKNLEFSNHIIQALTDAFLKGIEVGKSLNH